MACVFLVEDVQKWLQPLMDQKGRSARLSIKTLHPLGTTLGTKDPLGPVGLEGNNLDQNFRDVLIYL